MASCSVNTKNSNVAFIRKVHYRLKCEFVLILSRSVVAFNHDGFIFNIPTIENVLAKISFTNTGSWFVSNGIRVYFHQVQQLNDKENTVFQRNEHLELHFLALIQDFRKSLAQYIYLRSFLESLVKQLLCYLRGIDAVDSFHFYPTAF